MEVVPATVGATARAWDEQHLDLAAAAGQVGDAPTAGFTTGVSGGAARFARAWQRHAADLGDRAEERADALRAALADYLETDRSAGVDGLVLRALVEEAR